MMERVAIMACCKSNGVSAALIGFAQNARVVEENSRKTQQNSVKMDDFSKGFLTCAAILPISFIVGALIIWILEGK